MISCNFSSDVMTFFFKFTIYFAKSRIAKIAPEPIIKKIQQILKKKGRVDSRFVLFVFTSNR